MKYEYLYFDTCNLCNKGKEQFKVLGKRLNSSQGRNPKKKIGITTTIVKCSNCDLIFPNPQPIPESINDHYNIPPEDYWKDSYFTINENYFAGEIKWLQSLYPFKEGMKALDIGAGLGKCMIALEKRGLDVYGIEPSESFYQRAIDKMNISPEKLQQGSVEDAQFPTNHFDIISFGAVLEHLYDPSASITKALSWLKPGGLIQIEVPNSNWLVAKLINKYYRLIGSDYVCNVSPMHEPFHLFEFSLKSFQLHAEQHNYKVLDHRYYVGETFLPNAFSPFIKPIMKRTNTGLQLAVILKKLN